MLWAEIKVVSTADKYIAININFILMRDIILDHSPKTIYFFFILWLSFNLFFFTFVYWKKDVIVIILEWMGQVGFKEILLSLVKFWYIEVDNDEFRYWKTNFFWVLIAKLDSCESERHVDWTRTMCRKEHRIVQRASNRLDSW